MSQVMVMYYPTIKPNLLHWFTCLIHIQVVITSNSSQSFCCLNTRDIQKVSSDGLLKKNKNTLQTMYIAIWGTYRTLLFNIVSTIVEALVIALHQFLYPFIVEWCRLRCKAHGNGDEVCLHSMDCCFNSRGCVRHPLLVPCDYTAQEVIAFLTVSCQKVQRTGLPFQSSAPSVHTISGT